MNLNFSHETPQELRKNIFQQVISDQLILTVRQERKIMKNIALLSLIT